MPDGFGDTAITSLLSEEDRGQSLVVTDPARPDNPVIYVSAEFEAQTGYPPSEVLQRNCRLLQGPETDPATVDAIRRALRDEAAITVDILNYRKDGTKFWNRLRIRPLRDDSGHLLFFIGAQNPIEAVEARPGVIDLF